MVVAEGLRVSPAPVLPIPLPYVCVCVLPGGFLPAGSLVPPLGLSCPRGAGAGVWAGPPRCDVTQL